MNGMHPAFRLVPSLYHVGQSFGCHRALSSSSSNTKQEQSDLIDVFVVFATDSFMPF